MVIEPFEGNSNNQTLSVWGEMVVSLGRIHLLERLPGFHAVGQDMREGTIHYFIEGDECQIVSLHVENKRQGAGTKLVKAVVNMAQARHLRRVWLSVSNDNLDLLRFFQTMGFDLISLHRNTIEGARKVNPRIPQLGCDNIPVRHEFEIEYLL